MEYLQNKIQELEILVNSLTNGTVKILRFSDKGDITVEKLKNDVQELKADYKKMQGMGKIEAEEMKIGIIGKMAEVEFAINLYISNGELARVLREELEIIIRNVEEVIFYNGLSKKESKLQEILARYRKISKYIKDTQQGVDKEGVEKAIAKLILSIIKDKQKNKMDINLREEIPEEFAHEVVLTIQEELEKEGDITRIRKELKEAIKKKIQFIVLEKRENWNISELAYEDPIIDMYGALDGTDEEIEAKLGEYYKGREEAIAPKEVQKEAQEEKKETIAEEKTEISTPEEVYKELRGIKKEEKEDFGTYRKSKIREWQIKTGAFFSIEPSPDKITIITIDNRVIKMTMKQFFKKSGHELSLKKLRYKGKLNDSRFNDFIETTRKAKRFCEKIKVIIFGEGIKEIPYEFGYRHVQEEFTSWVFRHRVCDCIISLGKLEEVILGPEVEEIGEYAFMESKIEEIKIPGTVRRIGAYAFSWCEGLKKVILSPGLEEIGEGAFKASKIEEIKIPESVRRIGQKAFMRCGRLKNVELSEDSELTGFCSPEIITRRKGERELTESLTEENKSPQQHEKNTATITRGDIVKAVSKEILVGGEAPKGLGESRGEAPKGLGESKDEDPGTGPVK